MSPDLDKTLRPAPAASPGDTIVLYDGALATVERVYWEAWFQPAHWVYKIRRYASGLAQDLPAERFERLPANVVPIYRREPQGPDGPGVAA